MLDLENVLGFVGLAKGISHDCNKHVEEMKHEQEGANVEVDSEQHLLRPISICVRINSKFSHGKQVDMKKGFSIRYSVLGAVLVIFRDIVELKLTLSKQIEGLGERKDGY